jgi:2-polyprenyl-3-methyl-5-hydroxy-6-metoxy-1,4-benzoquinol methylase
MKVTDMARNWTRWGEKDPLWAVVTEPGKEKNRWDPDEFYATGEATVRQTLDWLASERIPYRAGLALDFGCGVGRLTRALAGRFERVHGVDISPTMIRQAQERKPRIDTITYIVNPSADLSALNEFRYDFIYSREVLQHIPTGFQRVYLKEFIRLLAPDGLAVLQTIAAIRWRRWLPDRLVEAYRKWKHGSHEFMPIYGISPRLIRGICLAHGATIERYSAVPHPTHAAKFRYDNYCIRKASGRAVSA